MDNSVLGEARPLHYITSGGTSRVAVSPDGGNMWRPACTDSWRLWVAGAGRAGEPVSWEGRGRENRAVARAAAGANVCRHRCPYWVWGTVLRGACRTSWGQSQAGGPAERCAGSHLHTILRMQEEKEGDRETEHFRAREQHIPDSI